MSNFYVSNRKRIEIWSDDDFTVSTSTLPHVSKQDGGHITIRPINHINSIGELTDNQKLKLIRLIDLCEKALISTLRKDNIEVPFCNNQDNGNWCVEEGKTKSFHMHIYGRALNSPKQVFGQALYFPSSTSGFYDNHIPLSEGNIQEIREYILTQPLLTSQSAGGKKSLIS